jgi:hypothetical protein
MPYLPVFLTAYIKKLVDRLAKNVKINTSPGD